MFAHFVQENLNISVLYYNSTDKYTEYNVATIHKNVVTIFRNLQNSLYLSVFGIFSTLYCVNFDRTYKTENIPKTGKYNEFCTFEK